MDLSERPSCRCHGEPMYSNGPYWRCSVKARAGCNASYAKHREKNLLRKRARYAEHLEEEHARAQAYYYAGHRERLMARYDSDPVYRISLNLRRGERRRAQTLERMRERVLANG